MPTRDSNVTYAAVAAGVLMAAAATAFGGQVSLKAGTLYVASSWRGTPDAGYDDVSNSDTVSHTQTFYAQATSSLPLSVATNNMYDLNQNGNWIENDVAMNWHGSVLGPRHFTLEATLDQVFELSSACDWTRGLSVDPVSPYTFYWLQDLTRGGAPIDLLTAGSGRLLAGEYRLTMHMAGAWDFDGLQFLHGNAMSMRFSAVSVVPAPMGVGAGAFLLAGAAGCLGRRHRRPF